MSKDQTINLKNEGYYKRDRSWTQNFNIAKDAKILDVGCGHGVLGKYLHSTLGADVTGVEIVESCYHIAKELLQNAVLGDIETMDLAELGGDYDYIIFSDCLEHLVNPDMVLRRMVSLLKADGHLLISIPNVQNFRITVPLVFNGSWEYTEEGLMDKTHLRWFTESSITSLVGSNGYRVKKIARELPLNSVSGKLNLATFGLLKNHLTSHLYLESCLENS